MSTLDSGVSCAICHKQGFFSVTCILPTLYSCRYFQVFDDGNLSLTLVWNVRKEQWKSNLVAGCDDNLCPSYFHAVCSISVYSCRYSFGERAITKWLANRIGATGILQTHMLHVDDFLLGQDKDAFTSFGNNQGFQEQGISSSLDLFAYLYFAHCIIPSNSSVNLIFFKAHPLV